MHGYCTLEHGYCAKLIKPLSFLAIDFIIRKSLYDSLYKGLLAGHIWRGMCKIYITISPHIKKIKDRIPLAHIHPLCKGDPPQSCSRAINTCRIPPSLSLLNPGGQKNVLTLESKEFSSIFTPSNES